jgi:hypothetical protein
MPTRRVAARRSICLLSPRWCDTGGALWVQMYSSRWRDVGEPKPMRAVKKRMLFAAAGLLLNEKPINV